MKDKNDLSTDALAYLERWHLGAERSVSNAAMEHDFGIDAVARGFAPSRQVFNDETEVRR